MILVVGLGNPGEQYAKARHNVGFWAVDKIAANFQSPKKDKFSTEQAKFNAQISEGKIGKEKIVLGKPQTFMNNSGKAVGFLTKYYKIKPENVFVIHDDADLPLGIFRITKNRGSAGHKGVESIMRALKTKNFVRFRIGTRITKSPKIPSRSKKFMGKFLVEQKITPLQEKVLKKTIKNCVEAVEVAVKDGVQKAMSLFNC